MGELLLVTVMVIFGEGVSNGLIYIQFSVNSMGSGGVIVSIIGGSIEIGISKERDSSRGGLGGILDSLGFFNWTLVLIFILLFGFVVVLGVRM